MEDLYRLYGIKTLEEYAKLADAGKLKLKLPEKQSDLKGRVIQMVEVVSTRVGEPKIDASKSIKKRWCSTLSGNRPILRSSP